MAKCLGLVLPLCLTLHSWSAFGTTEIHQTLDAEINGVKYKARHAWSLDGNKFGLDDETQVNETSYIFNGRTFYICSALDKKQIDFLLKNNVNAPRVLEKFKNGACQIVPSNFMARFFISPSDAVESIDRTDGMRLTLSLTNYKADASKDKEGTPKCTPYSRQYTLTKSGKDANETYSTVATETLCNDHGIAWREGLWKEVSKTVLRQPGGSAFMQSLREDNTKIKGLPLTARIEVTGTNPDGKKVSSVRNLSTQSVKAKKFVATHFAPPKGFEIFSPEAVARDLEDDAKSKPAKAKPQSDTINLPSILLCAISGSFVCLQ